MDGKVAKPSERERASQMPYKAKPFAHRDKLAFSLCIMAGYEGEPERIWDEYQWERFLQHQEGKAEKYMRLLEEYLDDPQRDEIIAREMGWTQLLDARDWSAEFDALPDEDAVEEDDHGIDERFRSEETFEGHDLYRAAFALTIWIAHLFDRIDLL